MTPYDIVRETLLYFLLNIPLSYRTELCKFLFNVLPYFRVKDMHGAIKIRKFLLNLLNDVNSEYIERKRLKVFRFQDSTVNRSSIIELRDYLHTFQESIKRKLVEQKSQQNYQWMPPLPPDPPLVMPPLPPDPPLVMQPLPPYHPPLSPGHLQPSKSFLCPQLHPGHSPNYSVPIYWYPYPY